MNTNVLWLSGWLAISGCAGRGCAPAPARTQEQAGEGVSAVPGALRTQYAAMAATAPYGITLPSGVFVPYPQGLTHPPSYEAGRLRKERKVIDSALPLQHFERARLLRAPPELVDRYLELQGRLQGASQEEALTSLAAEGAALRKALESAAAQAFLRGDRPAGEAAKELARRIENARRRLARDAERDARTGPRPARSAYVPPEFRVP